MYFPSLSEWWQDDGLPSGSGNSFIPDLVEEDQKQQPSQSDSTAAASEQNTDTLVVADMSDVPTFDSSVYNFKPRPINVEGIRQPLELPASGLGCLKTLFDALTNPNELAKVVRIIHYGDSQTGFRAIFVTSCNSNLAARVPVLSPPKPPTTTKPLAKWSMRAIGNVTRFSPLWIQPSITPNTVRWRRLPNFRR